MFSVRKQFSGWGEKFKNVYYLNFSYKKSSGFDFPWVTNMWIRVSKKKQFLQIVQN